MTAEKKRKIAKVLSLVVIIAGIGNNRLDIRYRHLKKHFPGMDIDEV